MGKFRNKIYSLYRFPYDDSSKKKDKPFLVRKVSDNDRFNTAFYGLEEGDANLLKWSDSLNMEDSSKFLNDFPQIAMTPQKFHCLYLVVNTILYTNRSQIDIKILKIMQTNKDKKFLFQSLS